jgi:hypothetical protein
VSKKEIGPREAEMRRAREEAYAARILAREPVKKTRPGRLKNAKD